MAKQAVLLLAHGTPETVEQIPEYLRNVVSGRPLPQAVIEEIQHRYALIGRSPLTEITLEQARLVEAELGGEAGVPVPVYVGMRNWRPYIPEVVRQMRADGVDEAAVICMAPQNSRTSVGLYRRAVEAEAAGMRIDFTEGWAQHPLLAEAFAERLRPALARAERRRWARRCRFCLRRTACHAGRFRLRRPAKGKPRPVAGRGRGPLCAGGAAYGRAGGGSGCRRFRDGGSRSRARGRAAGRGLGRRWRRRWTPIAAAGVKTLMLQPIGFLCDHVEILYDVDIAVSRIRGQAGRAAGAAGVAECLAHAGQGRCRSGAAGGWRGCRADVPRGPEKTSGRDLCGGAARCICVRFAVDVRRSIYRESCRVTVVRYAQSDPVKLRPCLTLGLLLISQNFSSSMMGARFAATGGNRSGRAQLRSSAAKLEFNWARSCGAPGCEEALFS